MLRAGGLEESGHLALPAVLAEDRVVDPGRERDLLGSAGEQGLTGVVRRGVDDVRVRWAVRGGRPVVEVDQEVAAVAPFGTGMRAPALPAGACRIGDVFLEQLSTVMGALICVRDHRRFGEMRTHVLPPDFTRNRVHLALRGHP